MEERMAAVVSSVGELKQILTDYCNGNENIPNLFTGSVGCRNEKSFLLDDEEGRAFMNVIIRKRKNVKLAQLWVAGIEIDWKLLYEDAQKPARISLPVYPFSKTKYWYDSFDKNNAAPNTGKADQVTSAAPVESIVPGKMEEEIQKAYASYNGNEVVLKIIDRQIAIVSMQDRENRNMFSERMVYGLMAKFEEIRRNKDIKVVVITGYDNVFCMGGTQEQLSSISDRKSNFTDAPFLYRGLLDLNTCNAATGTMHQARADIGLFSDHSCNVGESVYSAAFHEIRIYAWYGSYNDSK